MNILIISHYFWPENFRINELAVELANNKNTVHILTGYPNYPSGSIYKEFIKNRFLYNNLEDVVIHRVPVIPRGKTRFMLFANYLSFFFSAFFIGLFKIKKFKPDIIFVNGLSPPIFVGILSILISKLKKSPIVFWVLDLWPDSLRAVGIIKSTFLLKIISYTVSFIYNNCEVVLAHSRKFIPNIKKYSNTRVIYFPSWADEDFKCNRIRIKGLVRKNSFNLLFAGNIGAAQDFPSILSASKILATEIPIKFIIVGDGREYGWLKKEINRLGLNDIFILIGQRPSSEVPGLISNADALLVSLGNDPIFDFTVPGKIQTYLKSGKPIIGMINGEAAAIINNSQCGFTCPAGDYKGLARIITDMYNQPKKSRDRFGENGLRFYEKNFNKKFLINKLKNIFSYVFSEINK